MLLEWLRYRTTPCPRHLRDMGYLRESIGLEARARRCADAWAPHAAACRDVIAAAANGCTGSGRAVVLGSGPLIDVPIDVLADTFDEVVLVDILHPWPARRRAGGFSNVRFLTTDVTGIVEAVHARVTASGSGPLPVPPQTLPVPDGDLVVSVNLLSQLPLLPRLYLSEHAAAPEDEIETFAAAVVRAHLAALAAASGRACLISETEVLYVDGDRLLTYEDPLHGVDIGSGERTWTWEFAPRPEHQPDLDVRHRVVAIGDYRG